MKQVKFDKKDVSVDLTPIFGGPMLDVISTKDVVNTLWTKYGKAKSTKAK